MCLEFPEDIEMKTISIDDIDVFERCPGSWKLLHDEKEGRL